MAQLEVELSGPEPHAIVKGDIGAHPDFGPEGPALTPDRRQAAPSTELSCVDDRVVPGGLPVAREAIGHVLVADDSGRWISPLACLLDEGVRSAHVIHVAMGVRDGVDRTLRPSPERGENTGREGLEAGVEQDQLFAGVEDHDVRERLDERDPVADLRELHGHPVDRAGPLPDPLVHDPCRQRQQVRHAPMLARPRRDPIATN